MKSWFSHLQVISSLTSQTRVAQCIAKCQRAEILPIHERVFKVSTLPYVTSLRDSLCLGTFAHVFARKQCIPCSALRHKNYLTLPYVPSLRDSYCLGTFAHGFPMLPPRRLASSRSCSLATGQSWHGPFKLTYNLILTQIYKYLEQTEIS